MSCPTSAFQSRLDGAVRRLTWTALTATAAAVLAGCGASGGTAVSALPTSDALASLSAAKTAGLKSAPSKAGIKVAGAITGYAATVLADVPLAYYQLSDPTTTLTDAGSNGVNGTYGSSVTLGVTGLTSTYANAAKFPGGDYDASRIASVPPNATLEPSMVSLEAWVDASALNTSNRYQPIVAFGNYRTGTSYQLTITPINQFFFSVHTATASPSVVAKTSSSAGRVFHLIGTYDGTTMKLYVNGVLEGQTGASGAVSYANLLPWTGLAIGSGFDPLANHPLENYAGTIGDVSIYAYALTSTQVGNHYLTGVKTPPLTETPAWSDAFVDSIGVNAPFNYQNTVYDTQYTQVKARLLASGIRHIRAGLANTTWPTYATRLNDLANSGIRSELVTQGTETASQIQADAALVSASIETIEGPNEPDLTGNPNWLASTQAFMSLLHSAIKSDPSFANLPVIGPSVVNPANIAAFGNQTADLDYGNIHPYYGTNNPGNPGTGSITPYGRSGSLQYYLGDESQISGPKPIVSSETGYGTNLSQSGNVSELCDGKEAPRTYLVHYMNGVTRTLPYQLVESATAYGAIGFFSYMGFLHQDLTPKPSYNAISGLTAMLADKGSPVTTTPLTYTITGNVNNLQHLLMQKRDGTYYLALWLEVPSWNASTNQDVNAPPQSVTVVVPASVSSGTLATQSDTGTITPSPATFSQGSITIPIADRVSVLSFHP